MFDLDVCFTSLFRSVDCLSFNFVDLASTLIAIKLITPMHVFESLLPIGPLPSLNCCTFINLSCPCSLQALHNKLIASEASQEETNVETADTFWHSDDEIVNAVWTLVRMSASDEADSMRLLVSDFLSRVSVILFCGGQYLLLCKYKYLVLYSFFF